MPSVLKAAEDACRAWYCAESMDDPMLALRDALDASALRADVFSALALVRMEAKQARGAAEVNLASAQRHLERALEALEPCTAHGDDLLHDEPCPAHPWAAV